MSGERAGKLSIQVLELDDNRLRGHVPSEIGGLTGLHRLTLRGDAVEGPLPAVLLQKWDAGKIDVEPLSLLHDIEEVSFDLNNPSLLCYGYKAKISADGKVSRESRVCREKEGKAAQLRCDLRQGTTQEFDRLGRFLIRKGFFGNGDAKVATKDLGNMVVTARRRHGTDTSHTLSGPISLSDWSLQVMLEGIVARVEWSGAPTEAECSPN